MSDGCQNCPCEALQQLHKNFNVVIIKKSLEIAEDRQRITKLEIELKQQTKLVEQLTAGKATGSWGIKLKRCEILYNRLKKNTRGNGCMPWLTTGDVKAVLGVFNYSQAAAAMEECVRQHPNTKISMRGKTKIIEMFEDDGLPDVDEPGPVVVPERKTNYFVELNKYADTVCGRFLKQEENNRQ